MQLIFPRRGRYRLLAAALAALTLLLPGCDDRDASEARPAANTARVAAQGTVTDAVKILFLGDSLSAGYGLAEEQAFPAVVGGLLDGAGYTVEVLNAGVSGDTSAGGLSRLDWVLKSSPDVLVVELGANDALRGQPLDNIERNLRQIVRRGRESGARVLLLGMNIPSNYGREYGRGFAELYVRVAKEEGITLVPQFIREVGVDPALMQPDGLHPTAKGQRRLAETLEPHLRAILGELR